MNLCEVPLSVAEAGRGAASRSRRVVGPIDSHGALLARAHNHSVVWLQEVRSGKRTPMPMVRSCALLTLFRYAAPSTLPIASNAGSAVLARRALVTSARGISMMSDAAGDELVSAISADGSISAKAIITTELVAENSRLQGLGGLAAVALGRALTCSLLVAEGVEADETFQVNFAGDGPLRGVLAIGASTRAACG